MKPYATLLFVALALGPLGAQAAPDAGAAPDPGGQPSQTLSIGWFAQAVEGPPLLAAALGAAQEELARLPIDWIDSAALLDALRQRDRTAGLLAEAGHHMQIGRKQLLGLKLGEAQESFRRAVTILDGGFVRYYSPRTLAEPLLQLGVAHFQAGEAEQAHKVFMRVAAIAPRLQPAAGYYSPSVRQAYQAAQRDLGRLTPGVPEPAELGRICRAAQLRALVVASTEQLGDRPLLRLGLFDAQPGTFQAVETVLVDPAAAGQSGRELGDRLGDRLVELFGLQPPAVDGGQPDTGPAQLPEADGAPVESDVAGGGAPDGGADVSSDVEPADAGVLAMADEIPPIEPWYVRHWWIWPLTAAVVASVAVTLPLTVFREDVVDVRIRY